MTAAADRAGSLLRASSKAGPPFNTAKLRRWRQRLNPLVYVPLDVYYARGVSTDAKAIIGTIVGTGLVVAGLLSAQIAGVNVRIDDVNGRIDDVNGRLACLETDVRSMDDRLRAVEIAFGKVDQRLLTIERVRLLTATPDR